MIKQSAIKVRLESDIKKELERIAKETGLDVSVLVRIAVDGMIKEVKEDGGKLVLPFKPKAK